MARPAFKRWWTRWVPASIERSTYVVLSSAALLLLYWQWRTLPTIVWEVNLPAVRAALWVLFGIGWVTVFVASFMVSHLDLFGLRQVYLAWQENHTATWTFVFGTCTGWCATRSCWAS